MSYVALFVHYAIQLYMLLIFVWVLGSWFPQWKGQQWFRTVEDLIKPYMDLFKAIPLRIGMLDLSPMLALVVLMIVDSLLRATMHGGVR